MATNSKFDQIRFFHSEEVNDAILSILENDILKAIMRFTFPETPDNEWKAQLRKVQSIQEFQTNFVSKSIWQVLAQSSEGFTTSGFDKLDKGTAYLYISNHRDIILDTSLLNITLIEYEMIMTASAIGDNLVKKPFFATLSKLNRNFLVRRGLPLRELLESSKLMSEYIRELLLSENRSVWMAQREGRTKDGNDATHTGVLKMLSMAANKENLATYFQKLKIVPLSVSYEYDPTDSLKLPQVLANLKNEVYIKEENEDFKMLLNGLIGQKKHVHLHAAKPLDIELAPLFETHNANAQIKMLAKIIDNEIISNYKLWATNYIAYDMLFQTDKYATFYTSHEKELFKRRLQRKIDAEDAQAVERFLGMYANPVVNKEAILAEKQS